LEADKVVEGEVGVECADDPIAVAPGLGEGVIAIFTGAFGEASEVEPVACPTFAEGGGGEKNIDDAGVVFRGRIIEEGLRDFRRWREAGEIETEPANEGLRIGIRAWS